MAREIHKNSNRSNNNFVILDSMKMNINNFEENIFGSVKSGKIFKGHLEKANNGTLFIDNVNELPLEVQTKLLRVVTDQRFKRINDDIDIKVNFRLICSSSINLNKEVSEGNFREDLFHRLNVIYIFIPQLKDRTSDIPLLIDYFFKKFKGNNLDFKDYIKNLDNFYSYDWPGNVRELRNLVERIAILADDNIEKTNKLVYEYFNPNLNITNKPANTDLTLKEARDNFEREYLENQLKKFDGNVSKTAEAVGMERSALHRKLTSLNIKN
ncbi:MAG: sigma 54-interacting transcriptional regulator [Pelagibacteraceae bacterium]